MTMLLRRLSLLCLLIGASTDVNAATTETRAKLVGWRSPSAISLHGGFVGAERLREIVPEGVELRTDAREEGRPTSLMQTIVSVLSALDEGRVEAMGPQISVIGVVGAERLSATRELIAKAMSDAGAGGEVKLEQAKDAPLFWVASRWKPRDGSDRLTLGGGVANDGQRARLIAAAKTLFPEAIVIDEMQVKIGLPQASDSATEAMLAQLRPLDHGVAAIHETRFDLAGVSDEVTTADESAACASLKTLMPATFACAYLSVETPDAEGPATARIHRAARVSRPPRRLAATPPPQVPNETLGEVADPRVVDLLFATTRMQKIENASLFPVYTGERAAALAFGRARVRIPEDHQIGRLELPGGLSIFGLQLTKEAVDPNKHFILRSRQSLTEAQWDAIVAAKGAKEAIVFVHGFNTGFDDAVFRLAQIVWDLHYDGLPVLFSWASRGVVLEYQYDRESALLARDAFLKLLAKLREEHGVTTVHVIAHSMGNFLVLDALAHQKSASAARFGELIMAAPDVDRDQFAQDIADVRPLFRGLTLYASAVDRALAASKLVAGGVPRAGDVPAKGPIVLPGLVSIDVTALGEEMFGLNHTTFAQSRPLMNDISILLKERRPPPRLIEEQPVAAAGAAGKYWRFAPR